MINIEKAKKEFIAYTNQFDVNNPNIERKIGHSFRVMEISEKIAQKLNLDNEQIEIASLIGLLHDIGRFGQMEKYNTFKDLKSIDHGDYGVDILNKDMRKYIDVDKYDTLIKKAIKNHNKFQIEDGLTKEELLFSKIIRDADKMDIFYEAFSMFWKDKEKDVENQIISNQVFEQFKKHMTIKRSKDDNLEIDSLVTILAFVFDINFEPTFEMLEKEEYINKIINRFDFKNQETKEKMKEVKEIINQYIETNTK